MTSILFETNPFSSEEGTSVLVFESDGLGGLGDGGCIVLCLFVALELDHVTYLVGYPIVGFVMADTHLSGFCNHLYSLLISPTSWSFD